jgi:hypothetical protein
LDALTKNPHGEPDVEKLQTVRSLHRQAYHLQVEKVCLQQENEMLVKNYAQKLNEDMSRFEKEFGATGPPRDEEEGTGDAFCLLLPTLSVCVADCCCRCLILMTIMVTMVLLLYCFLFL